MIPRTDTLNLIQTSFPGHDKVIERAFREHRSFRDLCEDYRRCVAALHRWKRLQAAAAPPRWQEYTELLMDLGGEIESWLEALEAGLPRSQQSAR